MITLEQAISIVEQYLVESRASTDIPVAIAHDCTEERSEGWLFYYNSEAYLRTGIAEHTLLGAPALLVDRDTGAVRTIARQLPGYSAEEIDARIELHKKKAKDDSTCE